MSTSAASSLSPPTLILRTRQQALFSSISFINPKHTTTSISATTFLRFRPTLLPLSRFVPNVALSSSEVDQEERNYSSGLKLFVGNLPLTVDNAQLAELFESAGTVEAVEVVYDKMTGRSRGFGFVTMSSTEEVEAATRQFNAYELDGRPLRVNREPPPARNESSRLKASAKGGPSSDIFLSRGSMTRTYWNINLEEMMEAGVHFGHGARRWNPRMAPHISTKRKGIHIINLTRTARFLSEACDLVFDAASKGKQFLIVGTKNRAADLIARAATRARCHYVNKKWLGGMLTNWCTTETRLQKFRDLRTEQKTGRINCLPKKDAAVLKRQLSHLETYLDGIKYMTRLPDIVIIVDQQEEYTALRECITLGIPTICLIDTNCDPDLADISIPANDDAIASIQLILNKLVFAICEGRSSYIKKS